MTSTYRNLAVEPLWTAARTQTDLADSRSIDGNDELREAFHTGFNTVMFAEMIGTTARNVNRWRKNGGIPWHSADKAAIALGLHPILVWGDEWLNVRGDFEVLASQAMAEMDAEASADAEWDFDDDGEVEFESVGSLDDLDSLMVEAY